MKRFIYAAVYFAAAFRAGELSAQILIDDGESHVLTGDVAGNIYVLNQSHLTLNADSIRGLLFADNATVDYLSGFFANNVNAFILSNDSVINVHGDGGPYYDDNARFAIVDSQANFYSDLRMDGSNSIDAAGRSVVRLIDGKFSYEAAAGSIRIRDQSLLIVSSGTEIVDVPVFGEGFAQGTATDATISSLVLKERSSFSVSGGILVEAEHDDNWREGLLRLYDDARFDMTSGTMNKLTDRATPLIITNDRSQVVLRDVTLARPVSFYTGGTLFRGTGESLIHVDQGEFAMNSLESLDNNLNPAVMVLLENDANVIINRGEFSIGGSLDYGKGRVDLFGASGTSHAVVTGGQFHASGTAFMPESWSPRIVFAEGSSEVEISGGLFAVTFRVTNDPNPYIRHLEAIDASTITLCGTGFNYPLGPIADLEGTISGFLKDGSPIEWNFLRESTANIVLVPEVWSSSLFMAGALGLVAFRRADSGRMLIAISVRAAS